ncbi:hypothetical protein KSP39_PZI007786 [Platanthera zijinensis]|uniref:Uncharacterized protein n=1 Tax=Platanthera zijinensis TaxID=2320716 RepID=A0AAP0BN13_9ASPA
MEFSQRIMVSALLLLFLTSTGTMGEMVVIRDVYWQFSNLDGVCHTVCLNQIRNARCHLKRYIAALAGVGCICYYNTDCCFFPDPRYCLRPFPIEMGIERFQIEP